MLQRVTLRRGKEQDVCEFGVHYPVTRSWFERWMFEGSTWTGWEIVRSEPDFFPEYKTAVERDKFLAELGYPTSEEWYRR